MESKKTSGLAARCKSVFCRLETIRLSAERRVQSGIPNDLTAEGGTD